MKIGMQAIGMGDLARPDLIAAVATNAERLDFSTIWAPEHIVTFEKYTSKYPYAADMVMPPDTPLLNPYLALTYAAAHTKKIRLATGICLVPEYNPLLLAKLVASLDYLSNGRFALGMGIGWLEEGFKAMGIPWERRAARSREYIEAMRVLWGDERNYQGEFVNFEGALSFPQPINGAKLPILMGGNSEPALKRAAAYANGWCGVNLSPADTADAVARLRTLLQENGRDPSDFEYIVAASWASTPADLPAYRAAGIDQLDVSPILSRPFDTEASIVATLEEVAYEWVIPAAEL